MIKEEDEDAVVEDHGFKPSDSHDLNDFDDLPKVAQARKLSDKEA
jgi:hypothetical protein